MLQNGHHHAIANQNDRHGECGILVSYIGCERLDQRNSGQHTESEIRLRRSTRTLQRDFHFLDRLRSHVPSHVLRPDARVHPVRTQRQHHFPLHLLQGIETGSRLLLSNLLFDQRIVLISIDRFSLHALRLLRRVRYGADWCGIRLVQIVVRAHVALGSLLVADDARLGNDVVAVVVVRRRRSRIRLVATVQIQELESQAHTIHVLLLLRLDRPRFVGVRRVSSYDHLR